MHVDSHATRHATSTAAGSLQQPSRRDADAPPDPAQLAGSAIGGVLGGAITAGLVSAHVALRNVMTSGRAPLVPMGPLALLGPIAGVVGGALLGWQFGTRLAGGSPGREAASP